MPKQERYLPSGGNPDEPIKSEAPVETTEEEKIDIRKLVAEMGGRQMTIEELRAIITPEFLKGLAQTADGFSIVIDERMGPLDVAGRTGMKTRCISLNPYYLMHFPRSAVEGVSFHEAGHHAPPVAKLDRKMVAYLGKEGVIPEKIADTPKKQARVIRAINSHLCNGLLDCFLESYLRRYPYDQSVGKKFDDCHEAITEYHRKLDEAIKEWLRKQGKTLPGNQRSPKPEQLVNLLIGEDRYPSGKRIKDLVDEDVYDAYVHLKECGAIETNNNNDEWQTLFPDKADQEAAVQRKLAAFTCEFLPAWLKLFQAEEEKRAEEKKGAKGEKGGKGNKGGKPELGEGGGEGEGEESAWDDLTPEEQEEILEQLAEELEKLGEKYAPAAPSPEQKKELGKMIKEVEGRKPEEKEKNGEEDKPKTTAEQRLKKAMQDLLNKMNADRQRGLAENMGIPIEAVRTWEEIKEEKVEEIEMAAAHIADVFLDDRRKRMEFMKREGEVVPGLEYEYIAGVIAGEIDPEVHMRQVQNPEFLETEVEFIQDVSGSMSGEPVRKCIELQIIIAEAFRKVRESLEAEQLLHPAEEEPLRIGITKFETSAERVKKLSEPLNDEAEMKIVHQLTKGGGGTDEEQALKEVYSELSANKSHILKIMVVLSDGHGNKEAVAQIMGKIEEDDEVVVAAVGLGSEAKAVIESYTAGLKKGEESNVHAFEVANPKDLLMPLLEFFRQEISKRRKYH